MEARRLGRLAERVEGGREVLAGGAEEGGRGVGLADQDVIARPGLDGGLAESPLPQQRTAQLDVADPGVDVPGREDRVVDRDGLPEQVLRRVIVLLLRQHAGQVGHRHRDELVLRAEHLAVDRHHPAEAGLGQVQVPRSPRGVAELVERLRHLRVHRPEHPLLNREGPLEGRIGLGELPLIGEGAAQAREVGGHLRVILAIPPLGDGQRLGVRALGGGIASQHHLDLPQAREVRRHLGMPAAVALLVQRQHPAAERIGGRVVAGVEVGVGQLPQVRRAVGRGVPGGGVASHHLAEDPDGLVVAAALLQHLAQGDRGIHDRGVVGRQGGAGAVQSTPDQGFRVLEPGLVEAEPAQRHIDTGQRRVLRAQARGALRPRLRDERVCPVQLAEPLEDRAQREVELLLHLRFAVEGARLLHAALEQGHHAQTVRRRHVLLAALEEVQHEALDLIGTRRLGEGGVPRACQPQGVEGHQADHQQHDRDPGTDGRGMPADELPQPVADGVGPGLERAAVEEPVHLGQQRIHRAIAPRGVGAHRGETEHVEVGPGPGAQRRPEVAGPRRRLPGRHRGSRRLLRGDDGRRLVRGAAAEVVGQAAREQLVEHHPERVDVGVHPDPAPAELLGGRVGGGERAQPGAGLVGGEVHRLQLLGDAEVEQLHHAVRADHDVGGLEVAVDHRVLVGVSHCLTHRPEQRQPLPDAALVAAAPGGERLAVHELHREPRRPVGQGVGIVEPGDAGIVELRQGALLGQEPLAAARGEPGVGEDLDGGLAAEVGAIGEVHHAHSPLAQDPQQPVGPEQLAAQHRLVQPADDGVRRGAHATVQDRVAPRVLRQHPQHVADQRLVSLRGVLEEGPPLPVGQRQRLVEQRLDPVPACPVHRGLTPARGGRGPARRAPRASPAAPWPRRRRATRRSPGSRARRRSDPPPWPPGAG